MARQQLVKRTHILAYNPRFPSRYGTGIDWNEFHTSTPWNNTD